MKNRDWHDTSAQIKMETIEKTYLNENELNLLFQKGLQKFQSADFYAAHEIWEDMWHNKNFEDRRFIQGLIQISASFYKIQVGNLAGARSLLEKSLNKFSGYHGLHRGINVDTLKIKLNKIKDIYYQMKNTEEFSFKHVPDLTQSQG